LRVMVNLITFAQIILNEPHSRIEMERDVARHHAWYGRAAE